MHMVCVVSLEHKCTIVNSAQGKGCCISILAMTYVYSRCCGNYIVISYNSRYIGRIRTELI